ncbi:unnamed protein product [Soboliphyme baturini]|uniref:30S ribosomal protein S12 n=1 Tax=Soboliphyme baturini TaxID=241478 RepID=A0A183IPL7_9BILA|nr:unnamed protein product [Soboliphyme baturini]
MRVTRMGRITKGQLLKNKIFKRIDRSQPTSR